MKTNESASAEFNGLEKRLEKLNECLRNLAPLKTKSFEALYADPYLRGAAERYLEVAAQCCIDICHRIIALEGLEKPKDYREAILKLGEAGILPLEFAKAFAPVTGFRNILVHEYLEIDWKEVYENLQRMKQPGKSGASKSG